MVPKSPKKKGKPLQNTKNMQVWRNEFEKLDIKDHVQKLSALGLDNDDLEEFVEMETGKSKDFSLEKSTNKNNKKTVKKG